MILHSRNLIIDTSYFVNRSLNFSSREITALSTLVASDFVRVYVTDITEREIRKKISDLVTEAYTKINHSDARYLKVIPLFRQFQDTYPPERAVAFFEEHFERFKEKCRVEIISSDEIKVRHIFEWYVEGYPPFNTLKRNDKKHEFPDAFALAAILQWIEEGAEKAYLLSDDQDWKLFADHYSVAHTGKRPLEAISDLSYFTDLVLRTEESLKDEVAFADSILLNHQAEIEQHLKDKVKYCGFHSHGPDDETLGDIFLLGCHIVDKELIAVTREGAVYYLELELEAIIAYDTIDYGGAYYDDDDEVWRGLGPGMAYSHSKFEVTAEIELSYEEGLESNFGIGSEKVPDNIDVPFDEDSFIDINDWIRNRPVIITGVQQGRITEDGTGTMEFENLSAAQVQFPELNIDFDSQNFTKAMSNKISQPLRFETWRANEVYGS